jgi:hypothetical protein
LIVAFSYLASLSVKSLWQKFFSSALSVVVFLWVLKIDSVSLVKSFGKKWFSFSQRVFESILFLLVKAFDYWAF